MMKEEEDLKREEKEALADEKKESPSKSIRKVSDRSTPTKKVLKGGKSKEEVKGNPFEELI